jgi:predicted component of type VI protein secretion system
MEKQELIAAIVMALSKIDEIKKNFEDLKTKVEGLDKKDEVVKQVVETAQPEPITPAPEVPKAAPFFGRNEEPEQ